MNAGERSGLEWFVLFHGMEETVGEYRGLDRKSAYLSGGYRIGMVQLIKRKGFERRGRNRSQWTGDDQNGFESRVVDLKATVQLIKWKGSEWIGDDQNSIESRVGEHTALDHK